MFGKSASKEPATDEEQAEKQVSTDKTDKGVEDESAATEAADKDKKEEEKPKKASWWSTLTNPNTLSLLNSGFQEVMAQTEQGKKMPNTDQIKKAVQDRGYNVPEKEQVMKTLNEKKMPDQKQLVKVLGDKAPDTPEKEQLMQALAAHENANGLLQRALSLKDTAMKAMNPQERQRMMQEAYDKEVEANGQSKWARRLQSGPWQGGAGGAGIGAGVGAGLGTVIGTVVGGVAALPTTAVGGLVGMGVGGITGPFVKLNQDKAKAVAEREKAKGKSDKEIVEAVKKEAGEEVGDEEAEGDADSGALSQPEAGSAKRNLQRQQSSGRTATQPTQPPARDPNKPRKKPKKLEVRSGKKPANGE
ncbi:hypothetical protein LTR56_020025 [Elasticomyces elasticus]|nr:hypothetical protein LTR56_020025 [Elasticomyces elasticus]KAK4911218.1 hypothetical protein LTR49_020184 [Elasticomyces elasticus]KAK5750697.1 hypothetical protein LTS12_019228 [Elasticomyces elasticus]